MKVRLFAALRDIAGTGELQWPEDPPDVGALLDGLAAKFGSEFERIAAAGSVVVDGRRADWTTPLQPDEEVAVLPPVSGGRGG
jgi:MoaD family protein